MRNSKPMRWSFSRHCGVNESDISESESENEFYDDGENDRSYDDLEELEEMYRLKNAKRTEEADSDSDDESILSDEVEGDTEEEQTEDYYVFDRNRIDEDYDTSWIFTPYIFPAHFFTSTTATVYEEAEIRRSSYGSAPEVYDTDEEDSDSSDCSAIPQPLYEETDETANAEEVTADKIDEPDEAPEADAGHAQSSYEYAHAANKAVAAVVMERVWDPGRSEMGVSPVYHRKKPGDVLE